MASCLHRRRTEPGLCGGERHPLSGGNCPLVQEFFATMRDVYIILQHLPKDSTADDTADGRPATKAAAQARLGRAICADSEEFNHRDAAIMAEALAAVHAERIATAMRLAAASLGGPPETIILSGMASSWLTGPWRRCSLQRIR